MAKELPYFKFYVSEWSDGDITLEDFKTQGVFINICSYYWSNNCDVSVKKLQKRFKNSSKQIKNLVDCGVIKIKNENILICFLDKQLSERNKLSATNSENARKRWSENDASASQSQSEIDAIKKREEEIRKEDNKIEINTKLKELNKKFIENLSWKENVCKNTGVKMNKIDEAINTYFSDQEIKCNFDKSDIEYRSHFINWVKLQDKYKGRKLSY